MSLLKEIIAQINDDNLVTQVQKLCEKIQQEEDLNKFQNYYKDVRPYGPNIFLSLSVPGQKKNEVGFLTLERDYEGYICCLYSTIKITREPIRQKVWNIGFDQPIKIVEQPTKILTEYAKRYKFLQGE